MEREVIKNKNQNKIAKEPFSEKVLNFVGEKAKDLFDVSIAIMFEPKTFIAKYGFRLYKDSYYFPKEFSNLIKSPYFRQEGEKVYITEKGRIKIIKNIIKNKVGQKEKWDGFWRAVIFDIPEANRRERRFLRKELKWIGCREVQKSVWITPFDVEKELSTLLLLWKKDFRGDIRFLKIQKITGEENLKKLFQVK